MQKLVIVFLSLLQRLRAPLKNQLSASSEDRNPFGDEVKVKGGPAQRTAQNQLRGPLKTSSEDRSKPAQRTAQNQLSTGSEDRSKPAQLVIVFLSLLQRSSLL